MSTISRDAVEVTSTHIPLEALEHGHILRCGLLFVIALAVAIDTICFLPHDGVSYLCSVNESEVVKSTVDTRTEGVKRKGGEDERTRQENKIYSSTPALIIITLPHTQHTSHSCHVFPTFGLDVLQPIRSVSALHAFAHGNRLR